MPVEAGSRGPSVVSLVPSLTESMFDLGLGDLVAAATDYCVHPAAGLKDVPRIGGTKNPRVEEIVALHPQLVLANREENRKEDVEFLEEHGLSVWVTFPTSVREALDVLWELTRRCGRPEQGQRLASVEHVLAWTRAAAKTHSQAPVFCPIWRGGAGDETWWMTANGGTYLNDLLEVCGGRNVFAGRERRYPLAADLGREPEAPDAFAPDRDKRYPRVPLAEIVEARPKVILLPSEPYAFGEPDQQMWLEMEDLPAAEKRRVYLVDGSLLTWPGTRVARALQEIPPLLTLY
jgi:ABC-type Fe3+-hydroxamate transport system substrate-binding protein